MEKYIKEVEDQINSIVLVSLKANGPDKQRQVMRIFTRAFARSFLLAVFTETKSTEHEETLALAQTILEEEVKMALPSKEDREAMLMLAEALRRLSK